MLLLQIDSKILSDLFFPPITEKRIVSTMASQFAQSASLDTLNSHWKQSKSNFGFKMLQKMGWSEEKGLGKDESGITDAIKIKKRDTSIGIGAEVLAEDIIGSSSWRGLTESYTSVLDLLKTQYKTNNNDNDEEVDINTEKSRKKRKSKAISSDSDSEEQETRKKQKKSKKDRKDKPIIKVGIR